MESLFSPGYVALAISLITLVAAWYANWNKASRNAVRDNEARIDILEAQLRECREQIDDETQRYRDARDEWTSRELVMLRQLAAGNNSDARVLRLGDEDTRAKITTLGNIAADLHRFFSIDEIDAMAMDLGLNVDDIPGKTLTERARNVTSAMDRRNGLVALVKRMRELRPEMASSDSSGTTGAKK